MPTLRIGCAGDEPALLRLDTVTWSPRSTPGPPPDPGRAILERHGAENVIVAVEGKRRLVLRVLSATRARGASTSATASWSRAPVAKRSCSMAPTSTT